jgi:hypothetical protein
MSDYSGFKTNGLRHEPKGNEHGAFDASMMRQPPYRVGCEMEIVFTAKRTTISTKQGGDN